MCWYGFFYSFECDAICHGYKMTSYFQYHHIKSIKINLRPTRLEAKHRIIAKSLLSVDIWEQLEIKGSLFVTALLNR